MIIAKDLGERKELLLARSDAIIALPGGVGTLDEVTDFIELKKQGAHIKPIVILNVAGFYDGLKLQLAKMKSDGFLHKPLEQLVHFATSAAEALDYAQDS